MVVSVPIVRLHAWGHCHGSATPPSLHVPAVCSHCQSARCVNPGALFSGEEAAHFLGSPWRFISSRGAWTCTPVCSRPLVCLESGALCWLPALCQLGAVSSGFLGPPQPAASGTGHSSAVCVWAPPGCRFPEVHLAEGTERRMCYLLGCLSSCVVALEENHKRRKSISVKAFPTKMSAPQLSLV